MVSKNCLESGLNIGSGHSNLMHTNVLETKFFQNFSVSPFPGGKKKNLQESDVQYQHLKIWSVSN